jgi:hypothetical protein
MTQGGFDRIEMNLDSWSHVPFVIQEVMGKVKKEKNIVRFEYGEIANLLIAELSKTSTHRSAFAALAKVEHDQVTVPSSYFHSLDGNFTVRAVTGGGPDGLGTMFSVYKDVSLVAKALCGYHNGEVCTAGPTLEFIETASQWQCQSREIGSALLESLSAFDSDRFSHI